MKRDNQFSHIPEINAVAERLYTTAAGADRTDYGIPVENFAYHVGEIMSQPAPTTFTLHFGGPYAATVEIKPSGDKPAGVVDVWDQVTINGVGCGNRCGGRTVYTAMVRPYLNLDPVDNRASSGKPISTSWQVVFRDAAQAILNGRRATFTDAAHAAGWTDAQECSLNEEPGCMHVECSKCGAGDAVPPGDKPTQHKCPSSSAT
jgi:hypothetical protein